MTELIVSLNLPITAADSFNRVLKKVFNDSKIAAGYECGQSKTTALIKTMADEASDSLSERMKVNPFSLSTDGSNDQRLKQYPVVITLPNTNGVTQELLSVPVLSEPGTGKNIFTLINDELKKT